MINKENVTLIGRLENYKFRSAQKYLEGENEEVKLIVNSLAVTFENCGWIDGNIGIIIDAAISSIIPKYDE